MEKKTEEYIRFLSEDPEPAFRWKIRSQLLTETIPAEGLRIKKDEFAGSPIIQRLLGDRKEDGRIEYSVYDKWFGAHWVLAILADLGYPTGDQILKPLMEQCYAWLLSKEHAGTIREISGRTRRCASQEGNCIYYSLALGLADERTQELAERLIRWQWDDGGWNCDKRSEAHISSFNETLIPLRGLAWYANISGDHKTRLAVERAAEVFLKRQLIFRLTNRKIIDRHFVKLHYPNYWHYDFLFALKVLDEAGFIKEPRCDK
ncbi:MAG TPA: hypothetical protein VF831_06345, partial [Anaerolineales bacterium]